MKKKKVLKITPILITLNLLVLFAIAGFYTGRLVKYYKLENAESDDGTVLLVDEVIKRRSFLDETKGLVLNEDEGIYRYKGEVDDNYINYSGMMYRIIGIDKDNNIKAISEENVTLMYPGFNKGYSKSYINKWLNINEKEKNSGVFEEAIYNSDSLLENTYYCFDSAKDTDNITCEEKNNDLKITLLSLYDYKEAGGKTSFLNNGNEYSLGTLNDKNFSYYVTKDGDIALQQNGDMPIFVRPVITIKSTTELKSGNGSKEKPFRIEKHKINELSDVYVGSYIALNDEAYRVVKLLDGKVLVVKTNVLMNGEKKLKIAFGGENNIYTTSDGVGKYLNKTYLKTLDLKDSVVKGPFYTGTITLKSRDYTLLKTESVKAKVGMLTMGDMFINEVNNVLTPFKGIQGDDIINVLKDPGYYFAGYITDKYNVRPALYLKDNLEIVSGKGTLENPYIFKTNIDEKKSEEK